MDHLSEIYLDCIISVVFGLQERVPIAGTEGSFANIATYISYPNEDL
jgi:hypothetical protein